MIGFFGGSFDPVHYGHLKTARALKKELGLTQLFLMPCKAPVHKSALQFSNQQRLDMLNLAIAEFDDLQLDSREINRQSASYTIDTLKQIKIDYPNKKIFLIMGEDSFNTLETWKNYQQLSDYAQLVVLPRLSELEGSISRMGVYFAKTLLVNISSTQIRSKIRNQENLSELLPENIIKYIGKTLHKYE
ncbi:nicotinate-nucleotide adenylyltransferase [Bathymodiolus thermophilus thioautotrophic gill symbiont]|uniref:Probable nicotinate-nucleotide adenylyltransferase n=1 Tax=Bathymodiolus thermophilus thioautotrophic gill symbiont TaxID=2360 RepID=A0A3G3INA4_9GAMM|nr:nicotinate (nicotinamide) nucleotide adenylyltransferase [Bathymodiolus thermophilus thioautotrophic gill symbiont]AYQ57271.1 nicotinate-nucleotide adenylyltransferase [Bathymodiolus thermophilus thioautotrophic gill symbiont]